MPTIRLPLQSYQLRSEQASTSRLVNCYIEPLPADSPNPALLTRSPGLESWTTVGAGPIQGMHVDHGLLYVVSNGVLYSVTTAGTATSRGTVGSSTEIDMDSNVNAVVVVSPPDAFHYTPATTTFAQITDTDFTTRGAGDVEHVDGFMMFREPDSARFFSSDLNSVSAFDALMFATAEGAADTLVGMKVDHRQVVLFGEKSIELWENTGISGFPFERSVNGFIEIGCINGKTAAKLDNSVLWVADDYTVRRLEGLTPVRVSTHAVEQWLKGVTLASLRAYTYAHEGHFFYMLRAPEGAFFYDITVSAPGQHIWHERQTFGEDTWNWAYPVSFAGKVLVGSTTSNVIAELDPDDFEELDDTMRMEWTYMPVYVEGRRAFHDRIELVLEVGVGPEDGTDPEIMLEFSDDAGQNWLSLPNTLGAVGSFRRRVHWDGLGSCSSPHGRVYRAAVSDPVRVTLVDTLLEVRGGRL